jgi:hypothetical protein
MHGGKSARGRMHAVEKRIEPFLSGFILVAFPEAQQERFALTIGELGQILLTPGIAVVLEQHGAVVGPLIRGVAHQIAHQAYER